MKEGILTPSRKAVFPMPPECSDRVALYLSDLGDLQADDRLAEGRLIYSKLRHMMHLEFIANEPRAKDVTCPPK